ncbi:hypothetical protein D1007_05556 [Hordeum vulgare]|nr:hypothetical protein D1007_05556 [Hordeum vulgare]
MTTSSPTIEGMGARSGWKYHMTLKAGFFHVYPPHIGGPFRGLSEAVAAIEHHRASLAATSGAEASPARSPAAEASPAPSPAAESSLAPSPAAEPSLDPQPAVEVCLAPSAAEEASLDPQPAVRLPLLARLLARRPSLIHSLLFRLALLGHLLPRRLPMLHRHLLLRPPFLRHLLLRLLLIHQLMTGEQRSERKNLEYELVMIHSQCLIYDTFSKSYHHYNFTMRTRQSRLKHWNYQQYFAESKSVEGKTQYFCIPLQPNEHGHCFGCRKVGVSLRHPENGGYEKGNSGSGFPFDTDESAD